MADLLRISLMGTLPGGEEWSVNPVYSVGGDFGEPVSQVQATAIANAINGVSLPANILQLMSGQTAWTATRVEARSAAGALESLAEAQRPTAAAGTGTAPHPYQTACVFSLRTATPGPSGRGRMYWPATGSPIQTTDLRLSSTVTANLLPAVKTYLAAIDTAISGVLTGAATLCVWSRKYQALRPVNLISLGNVLDVQRRRRDTLIETVISTSYP